MSAAQLPPLLPGAATDALPGMTQEPEPEPEAGAHAAQEAGKLSACLDHRRVQEDQPAGRNQGADPRGLRRPARRAALVGAAAAGQADGLDEEGLGRPGPYVRAP
eukprot:COSAG04_NODE_2726_length_3673_cov_1.904589_6_plen_105_part_00